MVKKIGEIIAINMQSAYELRESRIAKPGYRNALNHREDLRKEKEIRNRRMKRTISISA